MHFKSSYIKFDLFRLMEKRFPAICLKQRTQSTMKNRGARDRVLLLPFSNGTKRKVSLTWNWYKLKAPQPELLHECNSRPIYLTLLIHKAPIISQLPEFIAVVRAHPCCAQGHCSFQHSSGVVPHRHYFLNLPSRQGRRVLTHPAPGGYTCAVAVLDPAASLPLYTEKQPPMFRDVTGPPKPQNLAAWHSSRPPAPARPCQSWSLHSEPWSPDRAIGGWALVSTSQRQGKQLCEEPGGGTSMWGGKLGEGTSYVRSWTSFGGTAMWGAEPGDGGTKTQAWHQVDSLPQHRLLQQPDSPREGKSRCWAPATTVSTSLHTPHTDPL